MESYNILNKEQFLIRPKKLCPNLGEIQFLHLKIHFELLELEMTVHFWCYEVFELI